MLDILLAVLTAACSVILPSTQITTVPVATPADYHKTVREGAPAPMTKDTQVSELRKTSGAQSGDWMACVKSDTSPYIRFFAVFIEDGKVKNFRRSVGIDQCESAMYSPLPLRIPLLKKKLNRANAIKSIQHQDRQTVQIDRVLALISGHKPQLGT